MNVPIARSRLASLKHDIHMRKTNVSLAKLRAESMRSDLVRELRACAYFLNKAATSLETDGLSSDAITASGVASGATRIDTLAARLYGVRETLDLFDVQVEERS